MSGIGVGDRVVVVRWPCCGRGLGKFLQITDLMPIEGVEHVTCSFCGARHRYLGGAAIAVDRSRGMLQTNAAPTPWVRKLDPLAEPEKMLEEAYG